MPLVEEMEVTLVEVELVVKELLLDLLVVEQVLKLLYYLMLE